MSQSQVYLFLYDRSNGLAWIIGKKSNWHAGLSLYGREYCYTQEGILAVEHAGNFQGAPLKRTFTLAITDIPETDFLNKINNFKEGEFATSKYDGEKNNCCDFARALIKFLLEIDHLEPELEEYLSPSPSSCNLV